MTVAAAGQKHAMLSGKLNIVCCDFLAMSRMPALNAVDVL
jgi:hypothetical protein